MPKKIADKRTVHDPDDVDFGEAMFSRAKRRDELPAEIERLLPRRRGPGKKPSKVSVTLRIAPHVVEAFKATGDGWQTRMNDTLERAARRLG